ncbi:MAG: ankyrin repeat domain-containing protein [Proteobacteria bacterium]|nr:ankyrin repeat domain-containing protein [Pseudomonadota bacterium]
MAHLGPDHTFNQLEFDFQSAQNNGVTNLKSFVDDFLDKAKKQNNYKNKPFVAMAPIRSLVLEGGGAKGAAYIGSLKALEKRGALDQLEHVAGSSAGAITALLISMGFTAEQIGKIVNASNFMDLLDYRENYLASIVYAGYLYSGDNFHNFAQMLVEQALGDPNATFADLEKARQSNPALKNLLVTATRVHSKNDQRDNVVFSALTTPNVRIADAVRASMSIPPAFKPVEVREQDGKVVGLFYDGGIMNNLPLDLLDKIEYAEDGYKMQYHAHQREKRDVPCNPCSLGLKLVSNLADLNNDITPFSQRIVKLRNKHDIKDPIKSNQSVEERSDYSTANALNAAYTAGKFALKPQGLLTEDKKAKYDTHPNNIAQIYLEGVDTMEFNLAGKKYDRIVESGASAIDQWWEKNRAPTITPDEKDIKLTYDKNSIKIENLGKYIEEFNTELKKYHSCKGYHKNEIYKNVRLCQLAEQIQSAVAQLNENTANAYIEKTVKNQPQKDAAVQQYREAIQKIIESKEKEAYLVQLIKQGNTDTFLRVFKAEMSSALALFNKPIDENGQSLLNLAILHGKKEMVEGMVSFVQKTMKQVKSFEHKLLDPHREYERSQTGKRLDKTFDDLINLNPILFSAIDSIISQKDPSGEILKVLLDNGADPFRVHDKHLSAFHYALKKDNAKVLEILIQHCQKNNIDLRKVLFPPKGNTLLHMMIQDSKVSLLKQLSAKATWDYLVQDALEIVDRLGITPHELCYINPDVSKEMIALFKPYFDPNVKVDATQLSKKVVTISTSQKWLDAFMRVVNEPHPLVLKKAIDSLQKKVQKNPDLIKALLSIALPDGLNLLTFAAANGRTDILKILLKLDYDKSLGFIDEKWNNKTALYYAIENGHRDCANLLRNYDADVNQAGPQDCQSALTLAAKLGNVAIVNDLIESKPFWFDRFSKKISRRIRDSEGREPLHYLAMCPNSKEVFYKVAKEFQLVGKNLSMAYGFRDVTMVYDEFGKTPLHYIIENDRIDILKYLVSQGVSMDVCFDLTSVGAKGSPAQGENAVQYALSYNKANIAQFLCQQCENPEIKKSLQKQLDVYQKNANERKGPLLQSPLAKQISRQVKDETKMIVDIDLNKALTSFEKTLQENEFAVAQFSEKTAQKFKDYFSVYEPKLSELYTVGMDAGMDSTSFAEKSSQFMKVYNLSDSQFMDLFETKFKFNDLNNQSAQRRKNIKESMTMQYQKHFEKYTGISNPLESSKTNEKPSKPKHS